MKMPAFENGFKWAVLCVGSLTVLGTAFLLRPCGYQYHVVERSHGYSVVVQTDVATGETRMVYPASSQVATSE
jgi:hypothetical protein